MNTFEQHLASLDNTLSVRGYRGRFENRVGAEPPRMYSDLSTALTMLKGQLERGSDSAADLMIWTDVPYSDIQTGFKIAYTPQKGFRVTEQHITHTGQLPKVFRFTSNHEILGYQAAIMQFPRPRKPWEEMLRGRPNRPVR